MATEASLVDALVQEILQEEKDNETRCDAEHVAREWRLSFWTHGKTILFEKNLDEALKTCMEQFTNSQIADLYDSLPDGRKLTDPQLLNWGATNGVDVPSLYDLTRYLGKRKGKPHDRKARLLVVEYLRSLGEEFVVTATYFE